LVLNSEFAHVSHGVLFFKNITYIL
jgi:hypothetical protein